MNFLAYVGNHNVSMDSVIQYEGEDLGVQPKSLLLISLAGCTGMDVIAILKKMNVEPEYFNVNVVSESASVHPKKLIAVHITYEFKGGNLDQEKILKAVVLSQDKYCGVKASLDKEIKMSYEIKYL